jgi:hypothetical protein
MTELIEKAFTALGPSPTWSERILVAEALRNSGDEETIEALECAGALGEDLDPLADLAIACGSSAFVALDVVTEFNNPGAHAHLVRT